MSGAVHQAAPGRMAGALRWAACLVLVLALHGGLVKLLGRAAPAAEPPPPDAVMIELAPAPEAPPVPEPAVEPPPPEPPPPAPVPQPAAQPPPDPPPVVPAPPDPLPEIVPVPEAPLAPPPEVVLPPKPKPRPVKPKLLPTPQPARVVVDPPPRSVAPASPLAAPPPASPAPQRAATWQSQLIAHIARFRRYPAMAQKRGEQGIAYVRFVIDRAGNVLSAALDRSSGHGELDREATAWLQRAQPLPTPPPEIARDRMELVLPMRFELQ